MTGRHRAQRVRQSLAGVKEKEARQALPWVGVALGEMDTRKGFLL